MYLDPGDEVVAVREIDIITEDHSVEYHVFTKLGKITKIKIDLNGVNPMEYALLY